MKKFIYILLAALLFCASCNKEQTTPNNGELPIFRGYMQFSTDVSSRTMIANDMRGKDFGVIGFKFSSTSNWATSKSTAQPWSDFYNEQVLCDANGICTYEPVKEWEDNLYSFFAYHPYATTTNDVGISLSANSAYNTPTLTYTYGWANATGAIQVYNTNSRIIDLMTAEAVDVNGSGTGTVGLNFKHRLFAFEVLANNYNETTYQVDANGDYVLDANGDKIVAVDASQRISGLTLTLEGLINTSMVIPLSMHKDEAAPQYIPGSVGTRTFKISDHELVIPAFNETIERTYNGETEICGAGVPTSISKYGSPDGYGGYNGGYLTLIPQTGTNKGVTGTLSWTELDGLSDEQREGVSNTFTSTITFEPGVLYQIHINFVGTGITIALIEAGTWDTHPDVEHTFE